MNQRMPKQGSFLIFLVLFALFFYQPAFSQVASTFTPDQSETTQYILDKDNVFISDIKDLQDALEAFSKLSILDGAFFKENNIPTLNPEYLAFSDKYKLPDIMKQAQLIITFLDAAYSDISDIVKNKDPKTLLTGELRKAIPFALIDKSVEEIIKLLEKKYGLGEVLPSWGLEEYLKASVLLIQNNPKDYIETITHLLDGLNQFAWASVGFLLDGPEGAKLFQQLGGASADFLRSVTFPFFKMFADAQNSIKAKIMDNYYALQRRNVFNGQKIQYITDKYSMQELEDAGFSAAEIKQLIIYAKNINSHLDKLAKKPPIPVIKPKGVKMDMDISSASFQNSDSLKNTNKTKHK